MAQIGIMGGTFDPIHNGHLLLGKQALKEYRLDEIWYMPSGNPPHKRWHPVTNAADRCEMVRLAIQGIPHFFCSEFEIRRPGLTYSSETLELLKKERPGDAFYFIIGADSFYEIEKWHCFEEVMDLAVLLVAERAYGMAKFTMEEYRDRLRARYGADIRFLHCEEVELSSSGLRGTLSDRKTAERTDADREMLKAAVPQAVAEYICRKHLYRF